MSYVRFSYDMAQVDRFSYDMAQMYKVAKIRLYGRKMFQKRQTK